MASLTRSQLKTSSNSTYDTNGVGGITATEVRTFNDDLIDSLITNDLTSSMIVLSASFASNAGTVGGQTLTSLNQYTASNDTKWSTLGGITGSFVTETESGSFLVTASVNLNTITFTKGNNSTFAITVNTGSAVTTDLSSLNSFTASQLTINTAIGASTSSLNTATASLFTSTSLSLTTASFNTSTRDITFTKGDSTTFKLGSFATPGSNSFNDNQFIADQGANLNKLTVSSSIWGLATYSAVSSEFRTIPFTGTERISTLSSNRLSFTSGSTSLTILPGWENFGTTAYNINNKPSIVLSSGSSSTSGYYPTIEFEDALRYTDGRVTIKTPLSASAGFTASLQNGYAWVGNSLGENTQVATSSFGGALPNNLISSSAQITALGFVSSSVTASSLVTASVNLNTITFTKGDNTTFNITVNTGSAGATTDITSLNSFTASQYVSNSFFATTASLNSYTQSTNIRLNNLESTSASVNVSISNLNSTTASQGVSITNLNAFTQSQETKDLTLASVTSSLNSATASLFTSASLALVTASFDNGTRNLTFTKGNTTQFSVNIPDVSGSSNNTGSLLVTASAFINTITFTKGDGTTFPVTVTTGSLNYVTGSFGAFYDTTTQSGSAGVAYSMKLNNTDISDGVIISGSGGIKVLAAGTYDLQFSAQVLAATGADTVWIWLKKNGINVADTSTKLVLRNNEADVAAWNFVVSANANDVFQLAWQSLGGHTLLFAEAAASNYPAIPSVIATMNRVDVGGGTNLVSTSSFNSYTSSTNSRLTNIESTTASLNISVTNLNSFTASQLTINSGYNTFTQSQETKDTTLQNVTASLNSATASLFTSASLSLTTASFAGNTLTFRKGDGTTFGVVIPDVSGSGVPTGTVSSSAQILAYNIFATTGSNTFTGNQFINADLTVSQSKLLNFGQSGSIRSSGDTGTIVFDTNGGYQHRNFTSGEYYFEQYANAPMYFYNRAGAAIAISGSSTSIQDVNFIPFSASLNTRILAVTGSSINTGSFATTGSNAFFGTNTFSGAVSFTGSAPSILSQSFSGSLITNLTDIYTDVAAVQQIVTLTSASYAALASGSLTNPNTLYIVSGSTSGSGGGGTTDITALNAFTASQQILNTTFATTGRNSFNGHQTITGSVTISGSTTSDLTVVGQILVSSTATGATTEPKITVSGPTEKSIIDRNSISIENATYFTQLDPQAIFTFNISTNDEIGFSAQPSYTPNWSTGPSLYINNPTDNYPAVFGFQNKANYTDGRVTVLTPLVAQSGSIITGSLTISGSSQFDLIITGAANITDNNGLAQLGLLPNSFNVNTTNTAATAAQGVIYATTGSNASLTVGVYDAPFNTDVELNIKADSNGLSFGDWDNVTVFDYIPFLTIAPNLGNNPTPVMTRGLNVTGSVNITGQYLINGVPISGAASINTGSFATTGSNTFRGDQTITGSLIISSSATTDLIITGAAKIVDVTGLSELALNPNNFNINATKVTSVLDTYGQIYTNTASVAGMYIGVYDDPNFNTDVEVAILVNQNGSSFNDWDNGTTFSYVPFMTLAPNTGNNPTPRMTRGLNITGNTTITGSLIQSGAVSIQGDTIFINKNGDSSNVILGSNAMSNITGSIMTSIAIGAGAMRYASGSSQNVAIGENALAVTTGTNNFALGAEALANNTTGNQNVAIGVGALTKNTTGVQNTVIGNDAGFFASGSQNTYIGASSGNNITGSNNTILGRYQGSSGETLTNNIILADGSGTAKAQYSGSAWSFQDGIKLNVGSNKPADIVSVLNGNATVNNSLATTSSIILLTTQELVNGGQYPAIVGNKTNGSFDIKTNQSETVKVAYLIINPTT